MNSISRLFLCLLALPLLAACGFSPLYAKHDTGYGMPESAVSNLGQIAIANIKDREGQFLRNRLIDRLHRTGTPANPLYVLQVTDIRESLIDLDITKTADSTRGQLRLDTEMTLLDKQTNKPVFHRRLRATTSYNILASEFSTRVSEQAARENALNNLAQQIETQLILHFKRNP